MEIIQTTGRALFDLFFPERCVNCKDTITGGKTLCAFCAADLPFTHWKFGKDNPAFDKLNGFCKIGSAYSLLFFEHGNVTQKLLHSLKYGNRFKIGILLAEKVLDAIPLDEFNGVIPVPVHNKKLKKRGYNQVVPFAKEISEKTGIPLIEDFLMRVENNPSQVFKNREKRLNSIQNAFSLTDKNLDGHFILIDDVLTTGATVSTCVNLILSKFPGLKISIITIACAV